MFDKVMQIYIYIYIYLYNKTVLTILYEIQQVLFNF